MGLFEAHQNVSFVYTFVINFFNHFSLSLHFIFSYTKPKGQVPDYESPVILSAEKLTVEDFCNKLHKSIMKEFKCAYVWGSSVKHNPQKVGKDHVLNDEDVVQVVKKV